MSDSPSFELTVATDPATPPLYGFFNADAQNNGGNGAVQFANGTTLGREGNGIALSGNTDIILPGDRTYDIEFAWRIANSGLSSSNQFRIRSVEDGQDIGVTGHAVSHNLGTNDSSRPVSRAIFSTPAAGRTIQILQSGALGEVEGFLVIKEIK